MTANRFNFKLWDKRNKKIIDNMSYGPKTFLTIDGKIVFIDPIDCNMSYENQDDYVIMQSTGLIDRNGKEIFEGDIIKDDLLNEKYQVLYVEESSCFSLKEMRTSTFYDLHDYEVACNEVIGNIYENPELLKN